MTTHATQLKLNMTIALTVALALSLVSFVTAHAAILAQFIGADDHHLRWLAVVQLVCIGISMAVLLQSISAATRFPWSRRVPLRENLRRIWTLLPHWLIFITVLLLANMLLGEAAIHVARQQGQVVSLLQHVPTLTIFMVCVAMALIFLLVSASE